MSKYDIDKSFGIAAKFRPPLNKAMVFAAGIYLKNSDRRLKRRTDVTVTTEEIDVKDGAIELHIITPNNYSALNPCLFYIHGGGFVYDAQPHQFRNAADYAVKTGSVIILPRYRLAPKVCAPTFLDDCVVAWERMIDNADKYKIDLNKIGVGGDSAGGYLAARLTNLIAANRGKVQYQLLIYPVIDSAARTESMQRYTKTPMWNAKNNKIMWEWYFRGGIRERSLQDETLPLPLPPTYIETAEFDCLHDEGIFYADKLKQAGVDVTVYETKRTMHGFDCVECEITRQAVAARIRFIKDCIYKSQDKKP